MGPQFETFVVVTSGLVLSARQTLPPRMSQRQHARKPLRIQWFLSIMFSAFQNLTESPILAMVLVDHQHVLKVATQQNL